MKHFFLFISMVFFIGCQESTDLSKATLIDAKIEGKVPTVYTTVKKKPENEKIVLEKMKYENTLALATIEANKIKDLEHIGLEKMKIHEMSQQEIERLRQESQKEIALAKEKRIAVTKDQDISFYKMIVIVVSLLAVLVLGLFLFIQRKNKKDALKMKEKILRHEAYMQESRHHHEKISKMLEIIIDENADKAVKKELVKLLKEQGETPVLLEHKS